MPIRQLVVPVLLAGVSTTALRAAQPAVASSRPTTQPTVTKVASLQEFRALEPVFQDKGWQLRVGWDHRGVRSAYWKLLYAHSLRTGTEQDRSTPPDWAIGRVKPGDRVSVRMLYCPVG